MTSEAVFVGIDVAQAEVVVAVRPSGENWTVATTDTAVATLVSRLQADPPALIVLEATGKLEVPIASALVAAALPVAIVNPRQVRDFAKATGQLAKTDTLDAHVLAHFAEAIRPPPRPLPDQTTQALRDLIHRRRQLGAMLTAEHIAWLHARITDLDAELTQILRESPAWRAHEKLLRTVPGVGPVVARTVLALLPEIQTAAHRPLAKLVGVAPLNHDSGTRRGKRTTWGGRGPVRCALFMATLVAVRHNPVLREHYQHLLARGKAKKTALIACLRKLLRILTAMLQHQSPWRLPDPAVSPPGAT
jgi:transposase